MAEKEQQIDKIKLVGDSAGMVLDSRYQVLERLGSGGMGTVNKGVWDKKLRRLDYGLAC